MCDTADSSHPLLPGNRRNHSEQHLKAAVRAACATQARSLLSTPLSTAHLALPSLRPPAGRNRSSAPYDKKRDYPYPQSVEPEIVRALGAVYGPYTGTCFTSRTETDIEHIVAASEAHDSGLCARDRETRARFASDLRNLTLAAPDVNRRQKSGKDAAQWIPRKNRCWFAHQVLDVRLAYGLTIDRREAAALEQVLRGCEDTAMEPIVCPAKTGPSNEAGGGTRKDTSDALARYDENGNGRITCKEARRHGIAPVHRSHPAYRYMRDGDGDGVVCE